MISEDQIKTVAAETMVPRSLVITVALRLWRSAERFTTADVVAAVMEVQHPALVGWRIRNE
jgi:hypothetical protein